MLERADTALVLFSGGQDSATCLAWALARFDRVETVGFDYGQRHRVELACRATFRDNLAAAFPEWAARLGTDHLLDARVLKSLGETAMTDDVDRLRAIVEALDAGANDYAIKPFRRSELLARIRMHLRSSTPLQHQPSADISAIQRAHHRIRHGSCRVCNKHDAQYHLRRCRH